MARRKRIAKSKFVSKRPQRNLKTKAVFDPSDSHVLNKKAKCSKKNKNNKRKKVTAKSNGLPVNPETEMNAISPIHSPINSAVTQETSNNCCLCLKMIEKEKLVNCPICDIRVHKACLIVDAPVWKFKLDFNPWLCDRCRKERCSKCLEECHSEMYFCISCEVGLHRSCYESYTIKPLDKIDHESNKFVCIPCLTLAIQINQEEVDSDVEVNCNPNIVSSSSTKNDASSESDNSDNSFYNTEYDNNIPNTLYWGTSEVTEYLKSKLPQAVIDELTNLNIDGRALQLLQRSDIVSKMGLKLGHALKLYKQVRILQTQSTCNRIFWE